MKTLKSSALSILLVGLSASFASADVILLQPNENCGGCSNILFNVDDVGNPLTAATQGGTQIEVSQSDPNLDLFAPSNGQARVEQEVDDTLLTNLFLDLSLTATTLFEFTLAPVNGDNNDQLRVTINDNLGLVWTFEIVNGAGGNRRTFQAINGQTIMGVQLDVLNGGIQAVEQIRLLEGPCVGDCGDGDNVPEPTSMALLGLGLLGAGIARRRKQ